MTAKQQKQTTLNIEYTIAASIVVLAGLLGLADWLHQSDTLLWSVIEVGLAWCF